nr:hypothetical protein [Actinomycetota bacterium]
MTGPGAAAAARPAGAAMIAFAAIALLLAAPLASSAPAGPEAGVTVTTGPTWGGVQPGGWTPYSATIRNDGAADLAGDIVLTPRPEASPDAGVTTTKRSTAPAQPSVTEPPQVLAVGGRAVTAPPPLLLAAAAATVQWPSYRVPVVVAIGSEKTLTVMVRAAPFGYDVEVQDRRRGTVASAVGAPALGARTAVLLLSDVQGADVVLGSLNQPGAGDLEVTQPHSVHDLPGSTLEFAGLNGVIIDDFDTTSLSERQRQALQDYVAFGGALVVAGGASWRRTLDGLPPEMTPVRFSGSTLASVGPLADLAAAATTAVAAVATGTVVGGHEVVGAPEGPPLVVEFAYGSGRVIQLAYDPLAEPLSSDPAARGPAWGQALLRMLNPREGESSQNVLPVSDQLGWSAVAGLDASGWPRWPSWLIGLITGYALAVVPVTVALFGRRRAGVTVAILVPASVLILAVVLFAPTGSRVRQSIIEVRTAGSSGAVLDHVYRAVVGAGPRDTVTVQP